MLSITLKMIFPSCNRKYDIIFDAVYTSSFSKCVGALTETGWYLMANTSPLRMLRGLWVEWTSKRKVIFALAAETKNDLSFLADLIATKKIKPVIDRTYALEQTIEAHRYVEKGLKQGSVIISVVPAGLR